MPSYAYFVVMQNPNLPAGSRGSVIQKCLFISEEAITKFAHVQLLAEAAMKENPDWGSQFPIFLRWERLPGDDKYEFDVR